MTCANCGHDARHGRRGHGVCRHLEPTAELRALVEQWAREHTPPITRALVATALSLPGMATPCTCRRYRAAPDVDGVPALKP